MKISYNRQVNKYVVSEGGKIKHICNTIDEACNKAGIKEEYCVIPDLD